jgi:hypothetical protein
MMHKETVDRIKNLSGKTAIYWDMDGTLAEFDRISNYPQDFYINKRPINAILDAARTLSENANIDSFVLSKLPPESEYITFSEAERTKSVWIDRWASFIPKENRFFITDDTILACGNYFGEIWILQGTFRKQQRI